MNIQVSSLAIATAFGRKTPSTIAEEAGVSPSTMSRHLQKINVAAPKLARRIRRLFGKKSKLWLVTDDTTIGRPYSKNTQGISSMLDHAEHAFVNGYKIVVLGVTNGKIFLPLDLEHWLAEFIVPEDYHSVIALAQRLILKFLDLGVRIKGVVCDGLYFSEQFINFLDQLCLKYVIKAKTTTAVQYKGQKIQLRNLENFRLNANQNQKLITAQWRGKTRYFTVIRRAEKVIYLVSNFLAKPKVYAQVYAARWRIEMFFRTAKQSLGLKNSQSKRAKTYLNYTRIRCKEI